MLPHRIGWDIGGAHLKAALLNDTGEVIHVYQQPCPLWKGLHELETALQKILAVLPTYQKSHAITMTGELVDFFTSRDEGVSQILATLQCALSPESMLVYVGQQGFIDSLALEPKHYATIASANWLASASFAAQKITPAIFVDIGSTTTDILVCDNHHVLAQGLTDYHRLQSHELIYTGIVRTAIMAVSPSVFFKGQSVGLMAEHFATMSDVYRLTGDLIEAHDQADTADGAEKTILASEFETEDLDAWKCVAIQLKQHQKNTIQLGCLRQLSRLKTSPPPTFIGAGIGRFLIQQIAADLHYPYVDFNDFFAAPILNSTMAIADCAPAVAVAYLSQHCY
jgi:(4-(4-[2-(gamma-L-glutamylamino)ethyl]phenoxymethyl)furan-2-yl)methanamine synthase